MIKHEHSINVHKDIKEVSARVHHTKISEDKTKMIIFSLMGLDFDEKRIAELLSAEFGCNVTVASYSGVLPENLPRKWKILEKIKFVFSR